MPPAQPASAEEPAVADASRYRLPRTVVPRRYEITLAPDLAAATFTGEEQVAIEVLEPVAEILLNAAELDVHSAALVSAGGDRLGATAELGADERLIVRPSSTLPPGPWTLHLSFSGVLNDKLRGFYRSTFRDDDGAERVIACTQFEATDARRAFPCWDEPDRKAVFASRLVVDDGLTAVSNSSLVEARLRPDGRREVVFADTIPMSTYLVAYVVGPLDGTDPVDVDGTPLRVLHVPGKGHLTEFALEVGAASLRFFAAWFGIPFPGDKLDLIGLPDFAAGAMENLGAVTFRETALLVDPAAASRAELERVADVVAHEIAHMWFGDLVTMKWWNGIWLNEAFATFMELLAVDDFRPQWERWVSFSTSRAVALATDGLASTRPVEYPVGPPEEAEGMFDVLTYQKGAAVLRMLERYLGAEPFRQGIVGYLDTHRFANAETTDLWDAIEAATAEPVRSIMDSWILQGGHPLVSAELSTDGSSLRLEQRRFRYLDDQGREDGGPKDGGDESGGDESGGVESGGVESGDGAHWQVPLLLRASVGGMVEHRRRLLGPEAATVDLGGKPDWVAMNDGGWGFYRVRYSGDLLRRLTADLSQLEALERFNLVNDTWATVLAGLAPVDHFVELARLLGDETDPNVWAAVNGPLTFFNRLLTAAERPTLQTFARNLVGPVFSRLGWEPVEGEGEKVATLRADLLGVLGTIGADGEVRRRAAELHAARMAGSGALAPDLVPPVVRIVAYNGGPEEYETFVERFRHATTPQEEVRYLFALADFPHPGLVRRTLEMALSSEVRTQNAPFVIGGAIANREGGELAWTFVEDHWAELVDRFPHSSIPRMVDNATTLSRRDVAARVRAFLDAHPVPWGQRSIEQTLERLEINVRFRQREAASLAARLRSV